MTINRTIGPLHFEDLEPKRFEDLVRQLIYDFRIWRRLEPTGRAGSDDGFDARGYEIVASDTDEVSQDSTEDQELTATDRLWLIQCKRERTITPKVLQRYLSEIRLTDDEELHGLVLVAACDFSKRSRDAFRASCEALGVKEWYLWGKADLEDLLLRPYNDHLLFAYFGISLLIRRRTRRSLLRSKLSMKRKAKRILDNRIRQSILLRSSEDTYYPYADEVSQFEERPPWMVLRYHGLTHEGLNFVVRRHFAYIDPTGENWDAALILNVEENSFDDPWGRVFDNALRQQIFTVWSSMDKDCRAWLEIRGLIALENIVDIDEHGDDVFEGPHVYIDFDTNGSPFSGVVAEVATTESLSNKVLHPISDTDKRIAYFNAELRMQPKKEAS